jgi:hypothetical protein
VHIFNITLASTRGTTATALRKISVYADLIAISITQADDEIATERRFPWPRGMDGTISWSG